MSAVELITLAGFGVLTGTLAGLLGVGGGIFMVPLLVIVCGLGQQEAQAVSLLVVLPTALIASRALHRKGVGDVRLGLRIGSIGVVGSVAASLVALALPGHALRLAFAALMVFVGIRLLRDARRIEDRA